MILICVDYLKALGPESDAVKAMKTAVGDAWPIVEDTESTMLHLMDLWSEDFETDVERMLMDGIRPNLTDKFKLIFRIRLENALHALGVLQGEDGPRSHASFSVESPSREEALLWSLEELWKMTGAQYLKLTCISWCTGRPSTCSEIFSPLLK